MQTDNREFIIFNLSLSPLNLNREINLGDIDLQNLRLQTSFIITYTLKKNIIVMQFILRYMYNDLELVSMGTRLGVEVSESFLEELKNDSYKSNPELKETVTYIMAFTTGAMYNSLQGTVLNSLNPAFIEADKLIATIKLEKVEVD